MISVAPTGINIVSMTEAKLRKTTSLSEEDRLSSLADDLICHILSFLPTKVAFKTRILSKRWTSLWTKVSDLHFKLPSLKNRSERSISIQFVSAVLLTRTEKIRKLSLHSIGGCGPDALHSWVTRALDLGVKELDLHLVFGPPIYYLPSRLSTSESLVVLKLQGNVQLSLNSTAYLPSLKILNLDVACLATENVNQGYLSTFLSGCPCLEELLIRGHLQSPLEISLHFLKKLCLHLNFDINSRTTRQPIRILNVPSVETLDIHDNCRHIYEVVNLFNVDQATLNIRKHPDFGSLYKLMEGLSNVKSLYLEFCTVEFLEKDNLSNLHHHLQFHNLLCLRVQLSVDCDWDILVAFLQNAPNLEVLIIEKYIERPKRLMVRNPGWRNPKIIPTCLLTNFKVLEFRGIQGFPFELDFMQYFIENSTKLEKVKFSKLKSRQSELIERNLYNGRNKAPVFTLDINSL